MMQLFCPITLMHSRLHELGLRAIDDGGAGDCFFRSVSHQLCRYNYGICFCIIYQIMHLLGLFNTAGSP